MNVEHLRTIADHLDRGSELHKTMMDVIAHFDQPTRYFLFGESATRSHELSANFEERIADVRENGIDGDLYECHPSDNPVEMFAEYDGWMGYCELSEEEYRAYNKAHDEYLDNRRQEVQS